MRRDGYLLTPTEPADAALFARVRAVVPADRRHDTASGLWVAAECAALVRPLLPADAVRTDAASRRWVGQAGMVL